MSETRAIGISVPGLGQDGGARRLEVERGVLARNQELAAANRSRFHAAGVLTLNVLSSPGSGKTTLLARLLSDRPDLPSAVIVGDLATDNDARRLHAAGCDVVQVTTGGVCHLEAAMVAGAADRLTLAGKRLLVIENVGNLVCPAAYDLGEDLRVVVVSVTEGEDKPLKYPTMFKTADAVLVNKMDIAEPVGLDLGALRANLAAVCPQAAAFEVSARTGSGMEAFYRYLDERLASGRADLG